MELRESLEKLIARAAYLVLDELKIDRGEIRSLSIHGAIALGDPNGDSHFLIISKGSRPPRFRKLIRTTAADLAILLGEEEFEEDCLNESLGGAAAGSLLLPYEPVIGSEFVERLEVLYKRHIALESLQNLILEHRLASPRLLIKPAFFLYDKLKRLAVIHPLIRPYIRSTFEEKLEASLRRSLRGVEAALGMLVDEGALVRKDSAYSPTERMVSETLSKASVYTKISRELEHAFKLYLSATLSSPLESIKELGFDLKYLKPVKIPEPSEMVEIETSLGPQPLFIDLGIKDFVEKNYGVRDVELKKIAGVLNAAYVASFKADGRPVKIFVKRYLNWTDFKWVAAWLWAIGVKNFSLLASIRMSNEIYFVNKLIELGFNAADILHVNWPRKMIFQKYIQGRNLVEVLRSSALERVRRESGRVGEVLGELHERGVCMGDCNPFSFIFSSDDKIYLVDLEQCSYDEAFSWDIAELLYYTSRYLKLEAVEDFAFGFVEGYTRKGRGEDILKAMDLKYARVLAPLTPLWIQPKLREAVLKAVKK